MLKKLDSPCTENCVYAWRNDKNPLDRFILYRFLPILRTFNNTDTDTDFHIWISYRYRYRFCQKYRYTDTDYTDYRSNPIRHPVGGKRTKLNQNQTNQGFQNAYIWWGSGKKFSGKKFECSRWISSIVILIRFSSVQALDVSKGRKLFPEVAPCWWWRIE